jgi:hypothetical protein
MQKSEAKLFVDEKKPKSFPKNMIKYATESQEYIKTIDLSLPKVVLLHLSLAAGCSR